MKIPKDAKKVFDGIIFDVYHYEQEMFDGTKETFEILHRPDTVQVIALQDEKIVMARESQPNKGPFLTLLGGRVDEGESSLEAAKRELKEEAGLASASWELYKSWRPYNKIDWEVFIYIARDCQKVAEPTLDAGEKIELLSVTFDEFTHHVMDEMFLGKEIQFEVMQHKIKGTLDQLKEKIGI